MENASKALLMAGGILIAIITIALLAKSFTSISSFQKMQFTEEEQAQLVAFNEQYTKYVGKYVYGTEVITVINKSLNNKTYPITTTIKFTEAYSYDTYEYKYIRGLDGIRMEKVKKTNNVRAGNILNITNSEDNIAYDVINTPTKEADSLTRRAFKCTQVGYDSNGRVNSIKFEEKKWADTYIE